MPNYKIRLLSLHYGPTIFLSAVLLFQVQPMTGKMIYPWFSGSAAVWTTCMFIFQILLLGFAHFHFNQSFPDEHVGFPSLEVSE